MFFSVYRFPPISGITTRISPAAPSDLLKVLGRQWFSDIYTVYYLQLLLITNTITHLMILNSTVNWKKQTSRQVFWIRACLQDRLSRAYFRVSAHLNFIFNVQQYTCISPRGSYLGPCKARHQDLCSKIIDWILLACYIVYPLNARMNSWVNFVL